MNLSQYIKDEYKEELGTWLNHAHAFKDELVADIDEDGKRVRYVLDGDWRMYPPRRLQSIDYYYRDKKEKKNL